MRGRAAGGTGRKAAGPPPALDRLVPVPTHRDHPATVARDLSGRGADGRPVAVPVVGTGHWTLLLFLSGGCQGCLPLWEALADPVGSGLAGDELVVAVTRDDGEDDPVAVRALLPGPVPVVMSSAAWDAYRVTGPPFFVLVDGSAPAGLDREVPVVTEGVAFGVAQVAADVRRARGRAPAQG